jgi:heme exporter protein D
MNLSLYWPSAQAFWAMNGYGLYVWGAFGVVALALALELLSLRSLRRAAWASVRSASRSRPSPGAQP